MSEKNLMKDYEERADGEMHGMREWLEAQKKTADDLYADAQDYTPLPGFYGCGISYYILEEHFTRVYRGIRPDKT